MFIKDFLEKNKEIFQLIYGIFLIVLIPLLITYNTVFIIKKYNDNLDVTLQKNALTIGRLVADNIQNDLIDYDLVQNKIVRIIDNNKNIKELSVLKPKGDDFEIVASSQKENVGSVLNFYYYNLAWLQNSYDSLVTDSLRLAKSINDNDKKDFLKDFNIRDNDRFWLLAMPINNEKGEKDALLSIKISSQVIDELTRNSRNSSVFLLVLTVIIVILFLLIAVRLWDYVLLYRKIKEVDTMKDEFISMASHELRTPVTGIRGYADMILDGSFGKINKNVKEGVEIIAKSSKRLAVLVEDLLNVSRIEQGRIDINNKKINPLPLIKDVVNELDVQAKNKKLKLKLKTEKGKTPIIKIDQDKLRQILINLIGNSIKYTEQGSVDIFVTEINNGKMLEIKIKDTGIGMSVKEKENLFKKFYRVRNEKTKNIKGTGLGLWITKQLVELMNGKITIESIKNVGTQINIYFPIKN